MAGILKISRRAVPARLSLSRGEGWEVWSFPVPAEAPQGGAEARASADDLPAHSRIGLPARHAVAVPIWLQTTDAALFREMIHGQLERRGMTQLAESQWAHAVILQEEGRTLVTAFLIDGDLPESLLVPRASTYEIEARCRELPADTCTVWREAGGLAVGCTRGRELAYLQFFPERSELSDIAPELACLRQWLAWERVLPASAPTLFQAGPGAAPKFPAAPLSLLPATIGEARRQDRLREKRHRLLRNVALVYVLILLAVGGSLGMLKWREWQLEKRLAASAPAVEELSGAAARWKAVQSAIDPTYYPMEALLACVSVLPPEVRLTQFDHNRGKVIFMGEGLDAASIFKFVEAVKADPLLKKWKWTLPQPQILPNNRAQFQLEGSRGGVAKTE